MEKGTVPHGDRSLDLSPLAFAHPDRKTIRSLFNAISQKYDFLNSFLSLGLHHYWRYRTVRVALSGSERSILDLGVGTGKSLATFLKHHPFTETVGCDFSDAMLEKARKRFDPSVKLIACDFHSLPFDDHTFDLATGSFILRSVQEMSQFLSEVKRVLKPGGKAVFLELTRPGNRLIRRFFFEPYLKFCIPSVGRLFSRHEHAYEFLSQSVQTFMEPDDLKRLLEEEGFHSTSILPLSLGAATIAQGRTGER